jgi:hypothetical protein
MVLYFLCRVIFPRKIALRSRQSLKSCITKPSLKSAFQQIEILMIYLRFCVEIRGIMDSDGDPNRKPRIFESRDTHIWGA